MIGFILNNNRSRYARLRTTHFVAGILPLGTIGVTGTVVVVTEGEPFWFVGALLVVGAEVDVGATVEVGLGTVDCGICTC
jgi:hypothetical protein